MNIKNLIIKISLLIFLAFINVNCASADESIIAKCISEQVIEDGYVSISSDFNKELKSAIEANNLELFDELIKNIVDINSPIDDEGRTVIFCAVKFNSLEICKRLLERKMHNPLDYDGFDEILFLGANIDVNIANKSGTTPLMCSEVEGNKEICELLLLNGADPNQSCSGRSVLTQAAYKGYKEICELLILHGADVNLKDKDGLTPLHVAVQGGMSGDFKLVVKVIKDLYSKKFIEICELLIKNGANIEAETISKQTPLYHALHTRFMLGAKLLISHGANVNAVDSKGGSLLHFTFYYFDQNIEGCELLLKSGADIHLNISRDGKIRSHSSPLELAQKSSNK